MSKMFRSTTKGRQGLRGVHLIESGQFAILAKYKSGEEYFMHTGPSTQKQLLSRILAIAERSKNYAEVIMIDGNTQIQ